MIACGPVETREGIEIIKQAVDEGLCKSFTPGLLDNLARMALAAKLTSLEVRLTKGGQVSAYYDPDRGDYVVEIDPDLLGRLSEIKELRKDVAITVTQDTIFCNTTYGLGKTVELPYFPQFYDIVIRLLNALPDGISLQISFADNVDFGLEAAKQGENLFSIRISIKRDYAPSLSKLVEKVNDIIATVAEALNLFSQ